jgi:hypothetical protein
MHIAAFLVGVCLILFCGVSLSLGLKLRANTRHQPRYRGIEDRVPLALGGVALLQAMRLA